MRPVHDADEDLGAIGKRYRKVHAVTLVPGNDGREIALASLPVAVTAGIKIARGQHTTVAAADTVVTGLASVVAVVVSFNAVPVSGADMVTASIGDQAGSPAAGSVIIETHEADYTDAVTFSRVVNWIAIGT